MSAIVAERLVKHYTPEMRHLILDGWSWGSVGGALGRIAGLAAFTLSMTLLALRSRTR